MFSPLSLNRTRPGFFPNQEPLLGHGLNNSLLPRRGMLGSALSPVGGRYGFGNSLTSQNGLGGLGGIGNGLISQGGLGGLGMGGLGGLNLSGVGANALNPGGLGINNLGANGVNTLPLSGLGLNSLALGGGGGLGTRGRLNPLYSNSLSNPLRNGVLPSNLLRNRLRGNNILGQNTDNHYVYPPADEHFIVPVFVQSGGLNRRINNNGLLGRMCGNNNSNEFYLTVPFTAAISDIYDELNKGKLDYSTSNVLLVTHEGDCYVLEDLIDYGWTLTELYMHTNCLFVVEN